MGKKSQKNKQVTEKKTRKTPVLFYTILAVVIVCLIGLGAYAKTAQEKANEPKPVSIDTANQPYLGKASAPVKIVEFGDYKCPYCKQFTESYVPKIKKDLVDTGKAKFYFINFPFIFDDSKRSAAFAESVYKELGNDTFWKFHESLYKAQPDGQQYEKKDVYTESFLTDLLKKVATDDQVTKVLDAFHNKQYTDALDQDTKLVDKTGIFQTPSVFIDGKLFDIQGNTYDDFKKAVEKAEKK
ncbi:MAG: DsbA family protein [Tuberibacillus sp.]